ncbi:hypothetical protein F9B74_06995 [Pelistega sp. NLN82]|uniref:Uncharacterized protein n=1 Tax=Pelistega ratti TaxID=2652177 RepID=A0A6L9Y870_9BURK|nr:hypothetical protein [Pelistega ratti]NEN76067.1 hypothetical protein [Pelistega ratti]
MKREEINLLLRITLELDKIIPTLDKIQSSFDDNDLEKIALSTLLYLSEEKILDEVFPN